MADDKFIDESARGNPFRRLTPAAPPIREEPSASEKAGESESTPSSHPASPQGQTKLVKQISDPNRPEFDKGDADRENLRLANRAQEIIKGAPTQQSRSSKSDSKNKARSKVKIEEEDNSEKGSFLSRFTNLKENKALILGLVVGLVVILGLVIFFTSGARIPSLPRGFGGGGSSYRVPTPTPQPTSQVDWTASGLSQINPAEQSPMRIGAFRPIDSVLVILMIVMLVGLAWNIRLDWLEEQRTRPQFDRLFTAVKSSCGLVAPIITPPLIYWTAGNSINFFVAVIFLMVLWLGAFWRCEHDASPLNTGLIVLAGHLVIVGMYAIPQGIGTIAGQKVSPWMGFYGFSGWVTLLTGTRFEQAALTTFVYILIFWAVIISALESMRRYTFVHALIAILLTLIAIIVGSMLTSYLGRFQPGRPEDVILWEIAKPLIGLVVSYAGVFIVSMGLNGRELKVGDTTFKMAETAGPQRHINLLLLVTTIYLAINMIFR